MPDSIKNIRIPVGVWTELYTESGILIGTQIVVENLTAVPLKTYSGATVPAGAEEDNDNGYYNRLLAYKEKVNEDGDSGAWVYAASNDGLVNVKVF